MDTMSIAALSVGMSQAQVTQDLGITALKAAMDVSSDNVEQMLSSVGESLDPNLGANVDILA